MPHRDPSHHLGRGDGVPALEYVLEDVWGEVMLIYHEFQLSVIERGSTLGSVCHDCKLNPLIFILCVCVWGGGGGWRGQMGKSE